MIPYDIMSYDMIQHNDIMWCARAPNDGYGLFSACPKKVMQQLMSSPMVQQMMSNPDTIRASQLLLILGFYYYFTNYTLKQHI